MKHLLFPTIFFTCILMLSGCFPCCPCKKPVDSEHSEHIDEHSEHLRRLVTQEYTQPDKTIEITTGQEFILKLVSNPTTGYGWRLSAPPDGDIIMPVTNTYIPEQTDPEIVGSGGHEIWTFRAAGKGKAEITMEYLRPWETDVPPIETNIFNVIVR